jgi:hypothetical protein
MAEISRRDFVKVLATATLSPFVGMGETKRASFRKVALFQTPIAGFYYHEGMDEAVFSRLAVGDELVLRREPDNLHDTRAIAVYTQDGIMLGYVPRMENPIPAAMADQEIAIGADICAIKDDPEDYRPVTMRLYMLVPVV